MNINNLLIACIPLKGEETPIKHAFKVEENGCYREVYTGKKYKLIVDPRPLTYYFHITNNITLGDLSWMLEVINEEVMIRSSKISTFTSKDDSSNEELFQNNVGLRDANNIVRVKPSYQGIYEYEDNLYIVCKVVSKMFKLEFYYGAIDLEGNIIVPLVYKEYDKVAVKLDRIINKNNKKKIRIKDEF